MYLSRLVTIFELHVKKISPIVGIGECELVYSIVDHPKSDNGVMIITYILY